MCELYGKEWHSEDVLATRFIPSSRLEGQAGQSAAMRVIFSTFFSQLSLVGGCMFMVGHLFQNYDTIYVRLFPTYTCNHSCYTI